MIRNQKKSKRKEKVKRKTLRCSLAETERSISRDQKTDFLSSEREKYNSDNVPYFVFPIPTKLLFLK